MITENDLFNVQKAIVYCFRNIPEYSSTFIDYLHDTLVELGGIKTLNYNDNDMSVLLDIITENSKNDIFLAINNCYVRTVNDCIAKKFVDNKTMFLTNVASEVINAVLPVCCTILDLSVHSKDSLVFKINLHN